MPYISKDVSTLGVTNEEEAILKAQQLDLIYSQSRILYEIIPEALRPTHDAEKPKPGPHADGVFGSINSPNVEPLAKQLHQLSIKHSTVEAAKAAPSPQNANVFAQTSQKGNQQPGGKNKREKKGREIKTRKNPQIVLMGARKKRKRLSSRVSCATRITSLTFVLLWNKPRSC